MPVSKSPRLSGSYGRCGPDGSWCRRFQIRQSVLPRHLSGPLRSPRTRCTPRPLQHLVHADHGGQTFCHFHLVHVFPSLTPQRRHASPGKRIARLTRPASTNCRPLRSRADPIVVASAPSRHPVRREGHSTDPADGPIPPLCRSCPGSYPHGIERVNADPCGAPAPVRRPDSTPPVGPANHSSSFDQRRHP